MRLLHAIIIPNQQAWVWGNPIGRNGMRLGEPRQRGWGNWHNDPLLHAYPVERGTPPPIRDAGRENWNRLYWTAWRVNPTDPLYAACGRIRSASRDPRWHAGYRTTTARYCPDCFAVRPDAAYVAELRNLDPWMIMARHLRETTPDPVSGV